MHNLSAVKIYFGKMVNANPSFAMSRLARELRDVQNNDDLGASIGLENDDDMFLWNVTFEGPE